MNNSFTPMMCNDASVCNDQRCQAYLVGRHEIRLEEFDRFLENFFGNDVPDHKDLAIATLQHLASLDCGDKHIELQCDFNDPSTNADIELIERDGLPVVNRYSIAYLKGLLFMLEPGSCSLYKARNWQGANTIAIKIVSGSGATYVADATDLFP